MVNLRIRHNMSVEVISMLNIYMRNKKNGAIIGNDNQCSQIVRDISSRIESDLSPFIKSDIALLFSETSLIYICSIYMAIEQDKCNPGDFISFIEDMSEEDFRKTCYKVYEIEDHWDDIRKFSHISDNSPNEQELERFMIFDKEWYMVKTRLGIALKEFYNRVFKDFEDSIHEEMNQGIIRHQSKLDKNANKFFEVVAQMADGENIINKNDCNIILSLCMGSNFLYYEKSPSQILVYGYEAEKNFDSQIIKEEINSLFSALSDEKRIEIIRLLGKREWYSNELAKHFDLTSATMSYHINKLLSIGIVNYQLGKQNKFYYKINKQRIIYLFNLALKDILSSNDY